MAEHEDQTLALLGLSLLSGVSNATIFGLLEHFGSASAALAAGRGDLAEVAGLSGSAAEAIARGPDEARVQRELDLMRKHRVRLVPFQSEDYPPPLKHLESDAPALLRMRGEYQRTDQLAAAVVGSRRSSAYGRQMATRIACDLASMGFTIVSGMARGIDSAAHRGALMARGRTAAVLGCGLAFALEERKAELAAQIAAHGAVLSELPMETPPRPENFPPRNRLISALALGVVVVEAAARSGSLITARLAAEQGKAVFAVPGSVDSPSSRGCHALIRDGATLVESARDVVEGLGPLAEPLVLAADDETTTTVVDPRELALNERETQILELIGPTPRHIDEIVAETGIAASIVSSTVLTLEIRGLVQQVAGQRYVRR